VFSNGPNRAFACPRKTSTRLGFAELQHFNNSPTARVLLRLALLKQRPLGDIQRFFFLEY
jgi:hypothetical protein